MVRFRIMALTGILGSWATLASAQVPRRIAAPPGTVQLRAVVAVPSPQGVTANWTREGVQVSWQPVAEAAQYLVLRGPDAATAGVQIAELPAGTLVFLDRGFNDVAAYQVVIVGADGSRGASSPAQYTPPAELVTAAPVASVRMAAPPDPGSTAAPVAPVASKRQLASERVRTLEAATAPVITSVAQPPAGARMVYNGQEAVIQGTGFGGVANIVLQEVAWFDGLNEQGHHIRAGFYPVGSVPAVVIKPTRATPSALTFVPQAPVPNQYNKSTPYFVIVSNGMGTDTSDVPLEIARPRPVQKITGVTQRVVRSGQRFTVSGVGLEEVVGAYFGNGTPGSQANPLFSIANRSSTGLQVLTTPTCNQEGILMLMEPRVNGGNDVLITADTLLQVACAPGTPSGFIAGTESMPNQQIAVRAGETIAINGTNLKYVTRVLDQNQASYPFKFRAGFQSVPDNLVVTLTGIQPGLGYQFFLDNSLTDPAGPGSVAGGVLIAELPTWSTIYPTWAEPGQIVTVNGHSLKYSAPLRVTVGGVQAQVLAADHAVVKFRLGSGTTAAPIEIENEAGKTQLTGAFTAGNGTTHPGFFVVSGPSSVTEIVQPRPVLAAGDVLVVRGQNLARLFGICVPSSGQGASPGMLTLRRFPGSGLGYEQSNTEMKVVLEFAPSALASGTIQLFAPTTPAGNYPPSQFACAPNPAGIQWP